MIQTVTSTVQEDIQTVVNVPRGKSENCTERKFWGFIRQAFLSIHILRKAYCFEIIKQNVVKKPALLRYTCMSQNVFRIVKMINASHTTKDCFDNTVTLMFRRAFYEYKS
jgi:hypothetical protein